MQKRIISILLSLFMILGTFSPLNLEVKAQDQLNDLKVEDNGEYVTIDITPMVKDAIDEQNRWQYSKYSTMGTNSSNQPDTKITVNLVTVGLGGSEFRWDNVGMQPEDIVLTLERITSAGTSIDESYTNLFSNRKRKAEITIKNYVSGDKFFIKANATENITVSAVDRSGQLKQVNQDRPVDLLFIQIPNTKVTTKWVNAKGENLEELLDLPANKGKFDFNFLNDTFSYKFDITNQDQEQHFKKDIRRALARKRLSLEKLNDSDNESIKFNNQTFGTYIKLNENTKEEKVVDFKTKYDPYKGGEITFIVKDKVYNKKPGEEVPDGYYEIAFNSGDGYFTEKDRKAEVIAYTVKDGTTWTDFKELVNITDFPKVNHVNNLKLKNWTNSKGEAFTIADKTSETISESMVFTAQFVELTDDNIQINLSGTGEQNAPRHGDKVVVGKTVKKGSDDVDPKSLSGKTVNIYKTIEAEPKKQLIGSGIVREDGSFTAAIHKDALKAGETIWAEIPTGKDKKISSEKYPTTVKLNPDELNKIIEIASKVLKNYENKKIVNKDKYQALVDAVNGNSSKSIEGGKDLVEIDGQNKGKLKIEEPKAQTNPAKTALQDGTDKQGRIDKAYENIKKAIEELTGNHIPVIKGPEHKEIFVGDALDLTQDVTVTDKDSTSAASDIVKTDGKDFTYTVKKVETPQQGLTEAEVKKEDIANINNNAGTYKVTYTATDKSDATATHTMTLVVKEVEVTAIKVTTDPTKEQEYLVKDKNTSATPDYTGMQVELTYNNGDKEIATFGEFGPEGNKQTGFYKEVAEGQTKKQVAVTELTVAPKEVGVQDSPKVITATYEKGSTKLTDKSGKAIIVQVDSDGNGKADESEKFDITYANSFEIVSKPKLNYTVDSSTETAKLNLSALIVKVIDTKNNVKYYTWEEIKKENGINVTLTKTGTGEQAVTVNKQVDTQLTPKVKDKTQEGKFIENHNGAELKVVVDLVKVENGKVVYETDGKTLKRETDVNKTTKSAGTLSVLVDKDKNGKNDLEETTDKPFITSAKNVPTSPTDKTPKTVVKGHAKPGVKIEIKAADQSGQPTGEVLGTVATVETDGTYEVTLNPQQKAGTKVVAIATEGEKKSANSAPKAVIDDMDEDGNDDSKQGFNISKATKIEFYEEPNLTYLVKEKTTEVTFDGKDADKREISVKISYEENGKPLSNVYKLSEIKEDKYKDIISIEPSIGTKDKKELDDAQSTYPNAIKAHNLVGKNLVVTLKKVVDAENAKEKNKRDNNVISNATATSANKFAIEIDADGNGKVDKTEKTEMPAIVSARNVKNANKQNAIETKVKVKALVGSTITIKDEDGKVVSDTTNPVVVPADGDKKYNEVEITLNEKQDAGKKVQAIAKLGEKQDSEPAESIVFQDLDNDNKPDGQGELDIANIVEFKLASNPDKMKYPLKATDAQEALDLTGLMVYLKDKNGNTGIFEYNKKSESPFKELKGDKTFKLELVKDQSSKAIDENTKLGEADDLSKVKVSLVKDINKSVETSQLEVFLDANGDGERDTDQTPAPKDLKALNKGTDAFTTITGKAQAGDVIKVYDKDGKEMTTDPATVTAGADGTFTIKVNNNGQALPKDTKIYVTAKADQKEESPRTPVFVKTDADGNGIADEDETTPEPDVLARNIGTDGPDGKKVPATKTTVEITTEPKADVTIEYKDAHGETKKIEAKADDQGKLNKEIEPKLKDGTDVKVTVKDGEKKPAEKTVKVFEDLDGNGENDAEETTTIESLMARNIGTGDPKVAAKFTTIEGVAEKGSKVTIKFTPKAEEGQTAEEVTKVVEADPNTGAYKLELKADKNVQGSKNILLPAGTPVSAQAQFGTKKPSNTLTEEVFDDLDDNKIPDNQAGQTERPAALAFNKGKTPAFTTITGEAEKGATVTAKVGTEVVGTATADAKTGRYTIQAKQNEAPIKEGVKIDVTAKLEPKAESFKQTVVVFNDTDETGQPDSAKDFDVKKATGMQVVASPDKMVYTDGDKLNLDGLKVLVTDVNGNKKIFTYNHTNNTEFTNAGLSVDLKQETELSAKDYDAQKATDGHNGRKLKVTLDTTGNTQVTKAITEETPTALTVNKKQSAKPTNLAAANQGDAKVTKVKGKAVKDAEIKITDDKGNNLLPEGTKVTAGDNGEFTADLNKLLNPGTKVYFSATEPGKTKSPTEEETVIRDKNGDWKADTGSKLSTPVINPIREKDEKVVVAAPVAKDKIQTITVEDQNGKTVTLTKDSTDTTGKTWKVDGSNETVKENNEGKLEIPVKDKLPLNDRDQIKVTFKDGENPANEAFDRAFVQKASQTPKVDPVYTGDKSVKIADPTVADPTAKTIKVKVNDNDSMTVEKQNDGSWKVKEDPNKEVKVEDGKIVVPLDPSAKKDDVIKVSTINDSGKASPEAKVTVEDKVPTKKPTIDRANKDENSVSGTAAKNAEVTVTVTPKGGEPKTFTGKADGDGNYKVTTDPLVDGDTVVVTASEPGKADSTSEPKVVGVDTSKLKNSIDKAEEIGGKDGANLKPNENPVDKALKDALDKGKKVKAKGDAGDPDTNQKAVDKAKEDLDKAIAQKEADTAVDNAKDKVLDPNASDDDKNNAIKEAQDKIDKIPGTVNDNPIKKDLQDKLDLIKKIKEGEDRLEKDDVTGKNDTPKKPQKDIDKLKKAIQDGKDALDQNNKDKYGEKTKEVEKAINILNQERINVSFKAVSFGDQTLFIRTSVPGARITVSINGKIITKSKARNKEGELIDVDYVTTDAFGTYTLYFGKINEDGHDFTKGLSENDEIVVKATKDGYNPGEYTETIY